MYTLRAKSEGSEMDSLNIRERQEFMNVRRWPCAGRGGGAAGRGGRAAGCEAPVCGGDVLALCSVCVRRIDIFCSSK